MFAGYGGNMENLTEKIRVQTYEKSWYIPSTVFFSPIFALLPHRAEKNLMRTPLEKSCI
jgi:hypothetical protein